MHGISQFIAVLESGLELTVRSTTADINWSTKESICTAPLKRFSQRCLLRIST